jgi:hypothetical protein
MLAAHSQLSVPHLERVPGVSSVHSGWVCRVVVGGVVRDASPSEDLDLRPGDLLLAEGSARVGDLCLLVPRGRGRPLVGRLTQKGLVAEPTGVPCCTERWLVAGRLTVLSRGASHGAELATARGIVLPFPRKVPGGTPGASVDPHAQAQQLLFGQG